MNNKHLDMSLEVFQSLNKEAQLRILFYNRIPLGSKEFDHFSTALFYCLGLFVEVVYHTETLENLSIHGSYEPINLDLYLEQIDESILQI
ncbi:hypothetical protein [Reichenbachiella versicolor]|uniref:hypothetical protein n=1 Tax=Reichenbachiella versicolor TaxID=1821036 RepID=UPI000D6EA8AA|nr:hypothetical protein [Reichenbachiella versicolor]